MTELAGAWFDGRDSRPRPVRLSLSAPGLIRLAAEDGAFVQDLAVADIALSPRLGRTPRVLRLADGGHVECADSPLFDAWFEAPSRIEAIADWLERRRSAALTSAALTLVAVVLFFKLGLPWLAERLAPRLPLAVEQAMGRNVLALLDRVELRPSQLPATRQAQLQAEFAALVRGLPRERGMHLVFRSAPRIGANAFALPDGTLVMTDALVRLARSDQELEAVMAHEAGHHEHHHAVRQALESSGVLVIGALLFGDVSGSSLTVTLPTVLLETGFSRRHEREADDFALALLQRRGLSPQAFADVLRRLSAAHESDHDAAVGYLSTHPPTRERIEHAEQAARAFERRR